MRKDKKADPKEMVLQAFLSICQEHGVLNATLQKAAKAAKVPFSTAHYYWGGDSEKLITAALMRIGGKAQIFIENFLREKSGKYPNPIECYIQGTFEWALDRASDSKLWIYFFYHASVHAQEGEQYQQFIKVARQRVLNLLYEAKGKGFYPGSTPNLEVAGWVHSLVFSNGVQLIISQSKRLKQDMNETTISAVDRLMLGG